MLRQLSLGSRLEPVATAGSGFQRLEAAPEMVAVGEDEAASVVEAAEASSQQQLGGGGGSGRRSPFRSRRLTTCRKRALGIFQRSASVSSARSTGTTPWEKELFRRMNAGLPRESFF
ncbi:uncharacterized protein LOC119769510 [Culex quinquefasciatus]|uniref:uncharacterized protein LOC119769510 n=1 Tax=Culex quinquefasciatus TaxID=7176 RepID=UPI0018E32AA8|nr:uncharacterized protein LOC119769510 [Culex quinquefasciatus]